MGDRFVWRTGSGNLALGADWTDVSSRAGPAPSPPGTSDSATLVGAQAGVITAIGTLSVAALTTGGGVALTGAVAAGTLTAAGTLAVTGGGSLSAGSASLTAGNLAVSGAGSQVAIAGALALAGDAAAEGGAVLTAGAATLDGGTLSADTLSAIVIGTAAAQAGTLAIGAGATLAGSGRLDGDVTDDGAIAASGGVLSLFGAVAGGGTLAIGADATLFAAGAVAAGVNAVFNGGGGVLELFTTGASFAGSITGMVAGDAIDIASATITSAAWAAGVLTLTAIDGSTLALAVPDASSADSFVPIPDGVGGTDIILAPASAALPTTGSITLSGPGMVLLSGTTSHSGQLTVSGTLAVNGRLTTTLLSQTGTIAVLAKSSFVATVADISAGLLVLEGARDIMTLHTLTLGGGIGGTVAGFGGATVEIGALVMAGGTLTLDAASTMLIGTTTGGTAGAITIAAGATVTGFGDLAGPVTDSGDITATGGALALTGPAAGSGVLTIGAGATLAAFAALAMPVDFAANATLDLYGTAGAFTGTLNGFAVGDALDLGVLPADSAVWDAGTLSILAGGTTVDSLAIAGDYTGQAWQAAPDGDGGTVISLASGSDGGPLIVTGTLTVTEAIGAPSATADPGAVVAMAGGTLAAGTLTLLAGATVEGHGMIAGGMADGGGVRASGGVLAVTGAIGGTGTVAVAGGATLYAPAGIAAGMTVAFGGVGGTLELFASAAPMLATVSGLAAVNVIDIAGAAVVAATYAATEPDDGVLTLTGTAGGLGSIALTGAYDGYGAATLPDGHGGTLVSLVPCIVAGTRIATPRGAVPVEALRVGDAVLTPSGPRRLRWVARRRCDAGAAPEVRPVRLRRGSLGNGLPRRDLMLSPQHALLLHGVLVPAVALVNDATITRLGSRYISYHHLAFVTHATILAEGVPVETFLPDGSRDLFDAECGRRPALGPPCAPRLDGGAALEALRTHLFGPQPPFAVPPGALLGHIERMTATDGATRLEGWALDDAAPANPVRLALWRDGVLCGMAVANRWRPDLDRAGLGGGRCSFITDVAGPPHGLTLRRAADGAELPLCRQEPAP